MNEYDKQAEKFLIDTKTSIEISQSAIQSAPDWAENERHGIKYDVEISNARGRYVFPFWDSIANKDRRERPSIYSVLACLDGYEPSSDYYDFCKDFGYTPSRQAEKIFRGVNEQYDELKKIFSSKELEMLQEIN